MMGRSSIVVLGALVFSLFAFQGCMGFGGADKIITQRIPGEVQGPKLLADWHGKFKWPPYNGPKKRVAVGVFRNATVHPQGEAMAKAMEAEIHSTLFSTNRFVLLERREAEMKGSLDEQDLAAAGIVHKASAPQRGKMIGAAYAFDATVMRLQDNAGGGAIGGIGASGDGKFGGFTLGGKRCEVELQVQIRDNQTGQIIASIRGEGYDAKASLGITQARFAPGSVQAAGLGSYANTSLGRAARIALNEAVLSIVNVLGGQPWKGVVVSVDEAKIAIKGGKDMNMKEGMRLKLLHRTQELTDPETGESLGFDTEEVATVVIDRVIDKASFAKLESGSLEDAEEGDFLNMIQADAAPAAGSGASQL